MLPSLTSRRSVGVSIALGLSWGVSCLLSSGCSAGSGGSDSHVAASGGAPSGGAGATELGGSGTGGSSSGGAVGSGGSVASGGTAATGGTSAGAELLHANFDAQTVGPYPSSSVAADFGVTPVWNDGLDDGRTSIVEESGNRFLRVTYTGAQFGPAGGAQFMVPLGESHEELYLSYRVRFASGFEFVKGGKLPGLVGGTAPTGCVTDPEGFSARTMWRTGGAAVQYMYFPEKVNACGDDYGYMSGGSAVHFAPGTWHTMEHRVVMNTPGEHDGILQAWFDGELVLDLSTFLYRASGASFGADALYFSTFFGGNDATWAPTADQVVDFDDFVISTGKIGQ